MQPRATPSSSAPNPPQTSPQTRERVMGRGGAGWGGVAMPTEAVAAGGGGVGGVGVGGQGVPPFLRHVFRGGLYS